MTKIIEGAKEAQPERVWFLFAADDACYPDHADDPWRIRRWSAKPFEGATEYVAVPPHPEPMFIMCVSCGSHATGPYTNECDCTRMGLGTQKLIGLYRGSPPAEVETMREALRRLIDTYKDMQDGDGNPCQDVAFAREVLGGSDEIAALRQHLAGAHDALKAADQALCDWANTYAPDECKPETVAAARARIMEGGTLAYIAETLGAIRRALNPAPDGEGSERERARRAFLAGWMRYDTSSDCDIQRANTEFDAWWPEVTP